MTAAYTETAGTLTNTTVTIRRQPGATRHHHRQSVRHGDDVSCWRHGECYGGRSDPGWRFRGADRRERPVEGTAFKARSKKSEKYFQIEGA